MKRELKWLFIALAAALLLAQAATAAMVIPANDRASILSTTPNRPRAARAMG